MPRNFKNRKRRIPRKRGGNRKKRGYRPQYNLHTLQISNVRPSVMRIPIQVKYQFHCTAAGNSHGYATNLYLKMSNPNLIYSTVGGIWSVLADTTAGTNVPPEMITLAQSYSHGHVLGSKCEYSIKFIQKRRTISDSSGNVLPNNNPNQQVQGVYSGVTRDNTHVTVNSQPNQLITNHNFREQRILCGANYGTLTSADGAAGSFTPAPVKRVNGKMTYSPKRLLGIKDTTDNDSLKITLPGSVDPTENTWACINIQQACDKNTLGSSTNFNNDNFNDFYIDVKMTYLLQVSEPAVAQGENLAGVNAFTSLGSAPVANGGGTFV